VDKESAKSLVIVISLFVVFFAVGLFVGYSASKNTTREMQTEIDRARESNNYIKILGSGDERSIELRQKAVELFGKKSDSIIIDQVLLYLNEKAEKRYSVKTAANRKFVQGRLSEGYTVDDLQKVIDTMVVEWKGTKMEDYLRPETLFNSTKFQTYINKASKVETDWSVKKV